MVIAPAELSVALTVSRVESTSRSIRRFRWPVELLEQRRVVERLRCRPRVDVHLSRWAYIAIVPAEDGRYETRVDSH
jgi:hypothetical protein